MVHAVTRRPAGPRPEQKASGKAPAPAHERRPQRPPDVSHLGLGFDPSIAGPPTRLTDHDGA
jgi:hypothetical protein